MDYLQREAARKCKSRENETHEEKRKARLERKKIKSRDEGHKKMNVN
jgi:hypothetical protein